MSSIWWGLPVAAIFLHGCGDKKEPPADPTSSVPTNFNAKWDEQSHSVHVEWDCNHKGNNAYEIQIAESATEEPFAVHTVEKECSAVLGLDFLLPKTTYFMKVRAHGGFEGDAPGNAPLPLSMGDWSQPTNATEVRTGTGGVQDIATSAKNSTTFALEIFRFSELPNPKHVDYLGNHDSSDVLAGAHWMTRLAKDEEVDFAGVSFNETTWTLYCVEVLEVNLQHNARWKKDNKFADYVSCNYNADAKCFCPPKEDLQSSQKSCRGGGNKNSTCYECDGDNGEDCSKFCPSAAIDDSHMYTGKQDMYFWTGQQYGSWYSHPKQTECPRGTQLGSGNQCNWVMHPQARVTKGKRLLEAGFKASQGWPSDELVRKNNDVIKKVFADLPLQKFVCNTGAFSKVAGEDVPNANDEVESVIV